nr:protocadherin Fat 4-like [Lytechinus pictus]
MSRVTIKGYEGLCLPPHQARTTMTLTVNDDNDHDPEFVSDFYRATVSEDASPDTFVIQVTATDVDVTADLRYQLNDDIGSKFTIDPLGGRIITSGVLDREVQSSYVLTVTVRDGPSRQATTSVHVEVLDVNDNPPQFSPTSYTATLPATSSQGRFVAAIQASDADLQDNAVITYSITSGDTNKFRVDSNTGVVFTKQDFTNENNVYNLQVTAENVASGQNSAVASLRVGFSTASFPVITSPNSGTSSSYSENVQTGMTVTTVTATGSVTYSIVGGNHGEHFGVGSQSGVVSIIKKFDYEEIQSFSLWIAATDTGNAQLSDFVELQVAVLDVNDNSPLFDQAVYFAIVGEEQSGQVQVASVSATDEDSLNNGDVSYSITSGDTDNAFDINSSGVITTTQPLDREMVASYILTVKATDGGNPSQSGSAIVVVTVTDINDNRMSFTRTYDATIPENAPPGTHVVTLHTTDPDENNLSQFSIEAGGQSSLFAINPITGEITLNSSLDFEDEAVHYLLVKSFDPDSSHEVQTQVTINVEDTNDNAPVFTENLINATYPEIFFSSGNVIATLSATDEDSGDNGKVDYILKTMTEDFRVETITGRGWIFPEHPISYITPSPDDTSNPNTYTFSVFAVDRGTPALYGEAAVIITVTQDNSYTPVFEAPSYFSPVTADTTPSTRVLQVVAVDEDTGSNAAITYSITGGNGTAKFDVEADSGWIFTKQISLTGDVGTTYELLVKATDNGNLRKEAETSVTFLITDSNDDAPVFDDDTYRSSIAEDVGGYVTTVHAEDNDDGINGEIRYSISGADASLFSIDAVSGIVSLVGSLDRENSVEHQIQVIAEDRAMYPQSATAMLIVTVTDVDDNPPIFLPRVYAADVFENSPSATPVVTVTATDADTGTNADFEYVISGGDGTDFFTINPETGLILTQGNLDFEAGKTMYYLTVAATNEQATMVDYAHVTVTLLGKNEFYPQFIQHQYDFYVNEHASDGAPVGIVLATDDDLGDDGIVNYLFIGGSNSQGFNINPESGQITVAYENGRLDREAADTILLSVLAKNEGPITGADIDEAEVIVHINDGNDAPIFSSEQYQARVLESEPPGTDVTVVTAADYDVIPSFRQFNYSILRGNEGDAFNIDARSGRITTASRLDRETVSVYFLTVAAIDTGNPPQTGTAVVSVELDDINDNGPVFIGDAAEGSVFENEPSNELVMILQATDPDSNPNPSQFTYTLLDSPDSSAFRLVGEELRTTQTLDREVKSDYYLQIEASDGESPAVSATSTIHITITDRNDNPSTLRQARIEVKMFQSMFPGGVIGSVKPIDPDTDDTFFCQITSGDTSKFSIQSNCDLHSAAHSTESVLDLSVSGNDGSHQSVTSSFNVVYESFTNDTLTNSVTLRLSDTSAEAFLADSYDRFKTSLSAFLGSRETLIVLSITDHPDVNKVDLVLAIKKQGGQHLLHDDLVNLLEANEATLESQSDIIIETIDYTACADSPCLNSGTCSHETNINLEELITESDPVIFVGLQTSHTFTCACPAEFSGKRCEIPTDYCEHATCKNGATCQNAIGGYICICSPGYNGEDCKVEINECSSDPCINGECQDLINGFHCECTAGYSGVYCENGPCSTDPCENGGSCGESGSNFICHCDNSHWGNRCQYDTIGFQAGSFISRPALPSTGAVILLEFSTISTKALLFFNHDSFTNNNAKFVTLEILNERLQLSFNFGSGLNMISATKPVSDGAWHKVEVRMEGTSVVLNILDEDCPRLSADACRASQDTTISLAFDNNPLTVGGVYDIEELLSRASQVSTADFVGCMKSIDVNGERLSMSNAQDQSNLVKGCVREGCSETSCSDGSVCMDEWWKTWCDCDEETSGATCTEDMNSVSFGGGGRVDYRVKEDYKRQALLDDAKNLAKRRRRRASGSESVSLSFRTSVKDGLLLYVISDAEFTTLQLTNGSVMYSYGTGSSSSGQIINIPSSSLTNGAWHNITLTSSGGQVTLTVDDAPKSAMFANPHQFTGLGLTGMALGGTEMPLVIDGRTIEGFTGCLDGFQMNDEGLPLDGDSQRFEAVPSAGTGDGCSPADLCALNPCNQGEQCIPSGTYYSCVPVTCSPDVCQNGGVCSDGSGSVICQCADGYSGDYCDKGTGPRQADGPDILKIVIPIVVVLLLVVIILAMVYLIRRRRGNMKQKQAQQQAGLQDPKVSVLSSSVNPGFLGDTFDEATMIGPDGKVNVSGLIHRQTPDIIEQNMAMQQNNSNPSSNSLMMENDTGEHVNLEMETLHPRGLDGAEHYDLENASSLAASDVDVPYHYKHFHDQGNRNRRKKKHRPNQNPMLARIQASPARLSPVSIGSHNQIPLGNDLAHSTPLDNHNALLRHSPGLHSNYSTNPTLRMGSIPSSGRATPARNISSPVNSDRSFQSELRSQAHRSDVSSLRSGGKPARMTTPLSHEGKSQSHSKGRTSKSPLVVGLTAEEVAQLNTARPDLMSGSHASTLEDLSSNSSQVHGGERPHDTPVDPSRLLEPPDSTSDDTNDSFTCSEMDSEYGKHGVFNSTEAAILDRLAEIEHAEDSVLPHVNGALKQKRLDSRGGSLSTLFTSEDENGHSRKEKTNGDVSLERLLGWGPRFDNLVDVFKDIAQLHENNGKIVLQASLTQEEFV